MTAYDDDELKKENVGERYILITLTQDVGIARQQNRKTGPRKTILSVLELPTF